MIGTLNESPLHAALKQLYSRPEARHEVKLEGFFIDVVQPDGELVEIQTGGFKPLRPKLEKLLDRYRMRIVHPIAIERRLVRSSSTRRSPKKECLHHLFERLVSFPTLIGHPHLTLEVVLIKEDRHMPQKVRHLREVVSSRIIRDQEDLLDLLPPLSQFTTQELARALQCQREVAQCMIYCLRTAKVIEAEGKRGRSWLYSRVAPPLRQQEGLTSIENPCTA